ncbi:MAG TPA: pyridoxamine 5'-phosphate oxidase family protein [Polyangiaceae bacterium]|nr:pyridoxamine 5'-phosphate oxidase family protein [Polyangiaceae bacterium]
MDEQENLSGGAAIDKIRQIAEGEIAMMHTFGKSEVSVARPMATAGVDSDGSLWFLSPAGSFKNEQIQKGDAVQVTYSLKASSEHLVLDGTAVVLRDRQKLDELWSALDKNWFPGAKMTRPSR